MDSVQYLVKVDTNGMKRSVVLKAEDEASAAKKALALFRQVELIRVEKYQFLRNR